MNYNTLQIGQNIYLYGFSSIWKYIYLGDKKFENEQKEVIQISNTVLNTAFDSYDLALIQTFKNECEHLQNEIKKHKNLLDNYTKQLTEVKEKYNYLMEMYPEEFI